MSRQFKAIVVLNILFVFLFVYFNWAISSKWGPVWIQVQPSPHLWESAVVLFPNYPLMLFLISTTINLYFLIKLQKIRQE
jgi:hypothetical protein